MLYPLASLASNCSSPTMTWSWPTGIGERRSARTCDAPLTYAKRCLRSALHVFDVLAYLGICAKCVYGMCAL
eukprot:3966975-Pleurochrysis_carterae.AAC.1